jgi:hypothetical protein
MKLRLLPMTKPTLRVTKWLADIPVEACCSVCPTQPFRAEPKHHRPEKINYQKQLMDAFNRHIADAHKDVNVA